MQTNWYILPETVWTSIYTWTWWRAEYLWRIVYWEVYIPYGDIHW